MKKQGYDPKEAKKGPLVKDGEANGLTIDLGYEPKPEEIKEMLKEKMKRK